MAVDTAWSSAIKYFFQKHLLVVSNAVTTDKLSLSGKMAAMSVEEISFISKENELISEDNLTLTKKIGDYSRFP